MARNRLFLCSVRLLAGYAALTSLWASEHHGVVKSDGLPVPGATITAVQDDKKFVTTTDGNGDYSFRNLADGVWNIEVSMLGFSTVKKEIGVMATAPVAEWELKLMSVAEVKAALAPHPADAPKPEAESTTAAAATPSSATPAPEAAKPTAAPTNRPNGNNAANGANGARPSLRQAVQNQQQRGNGFQRLDVNQSGDLSAAGNEGAITNEMANELGTSASESMLMQGSVSSGVGMPGSGDWGRMDGMGPMMGGPGMMGAGP